MRVVNSVFWKVRAVVVFNDASRLHVGERKRLGQILEASRLHNFFFVDLAVKVDDRSIRPNGPGLDAVDILNILDERNFHIRILAALFHEYLFPHVVELVRGPACAVVPVNLTIKNDCWSPGRLWLTGHLQLFLRDRLPFVAGAYGRRALRDAKNEQQQNEHGHSAIAHGGPSNWS